jgi:hypothetical protein
MQKVDRGSEPVQIYFFARALLINMVHVINYCFCCVGQEAARTSFMTG